MLNAEIELIRVRPLHGAIGVPVKAGEWAWACNRWACSGGSLRQPCGRGSVEGVQAATQLPRIRPRSLVVLRTLRNGCPVVVEPAVSGSQNGIVRQLVGEPNPRLEVCEVVLRDGPVRMGSDNHVVREIALPWLRV